MKTLSTTPRSALTLPGQRSDKPEVHEWPVLENMCRDNCFEIMLQATKAYAADCVRNKRDFRNGKEGASKELGTILARFDGFMVKFTEMR